MGGSTYSEIRREFGRSRMGIVGIIMLAMLAAASLAALAAIPSETLHQWNNPERWLEYPKTAMPAWINLFTAEKIPEHLIMESPYTAWATSGGISLESHLFEVDFGYSDFPNGFIYEFASEYSGSPLLRVSVERPDGTLLMLLSESLPYSEGTTTYQSRIFSTDSAVRKNVQMQSGIFGFDAGRIASEGLIFSDTRANEPLHGRYAFTVELYSAGGHAAEMLDSRLILGGRAFGMAGTDELRRDLAVGLLWGTPIALFIGITVSVASVTLGLMYGVYAGFRGQKTDEVMMRLNDVVYALPALPFLIILSVTISSSIFVMIGFLMVFGWVGIAKVSRSMSLQIRTRGYVDASEIMGQKRRVIMFKHILPQLLPYAFASIAISVPAAITTEAGLSFLGLGDPSFPTWGHILHDANTFGAAARGLWWWIVPPGIMIAVTGLAFVFIGNAFDAIANPRLKRR